MTFARLLAPGADLQSPVLSTFLLISWVLLLSVSWLLPVQLPPWSTFPADTWIAALAAVGMLALIWRDRSTVHWHAMTIVVAALVCVPWLQWSAGILPYIGQAWISSTYLLGFLLALLAGTRWERVAPGQLIHGLLLAVLVAAIASVGLQLYTWTGLSEDGPLEWWSMGRLSSRPSANLGQPNQLATLLLWGLMACLWAYIKGWFSGVSAVAVASFLLLGLAMTQSRTGLLALSLIVVALWLWRGLWRSYGVPIVCTGLYVVFFSYALALSWLDGMLLLDQEPIRLRLAQADELRLVGWRIFYHAILEQPLWGYGWTQVTAAQMAVAPTSPAIGGVFTYSHNLFVDLLIWCGLPLGLFLMGFLLVWFWRSALAVVTAADAVLIMVIGVVAVHAMLEFPLHYAYFLIPTGLFIGILNVRLKANVLRTTPAWTFSVTWLIAVTVLAITVRDYTRVEESFGLLRIDQSPLGQNRPPAGGPPDVLVLTQLREWVKIARIKPAPGMAPQTLVEMEQLIRSNPSLPSAYKLAMALALNGQPLKAQAWLGLICKFANPKECALAKRSWLEDASQDPRLSGTPWPADN